MVYGALGSGPLGMAALQVLLAAEACATLYTLLRRTLASASTSMFEAVSHAGVCETACHWHVQNSHAPEAPGELLVAGVSGLPVQHSATLGACRVGDLLQVLAHRGLTSVQKFSPAELEDIRQEASAERQRQQRAAPQRGLLAKILRLALRRVGQRVVTAPLMLIPGGKTRGVSPLCRFLLSIHIVRGTMIVCAFAFDTR